VDPKRAKVILQIAPPHSNNSMELFFGRINFVRRFVLDFAEIVNPLQRMIKKDIQLKWTPMKKGSFENIKVSIATAPYLRSLDFSRYFLLYTFTYDHSLAVELMKIYEKGDEYLIAFIINRL
jgi:hypothetical protein